MPFRKFASLALLWLAACSQEPDVPEPEPSGSSTSIPAPAATPQPTAQSEGDTISLAFRGAWDWTGGTCEADSDLRMEIGAREINFYESVGAVEAVREDNGTLSVDLAMKGEGMQWRQTTVLRLAGGGTFLETEHEDPSGVGTMRLKRCPGEIKAP